MTTLYKMSMQEVRKECGINVGKNINGYAGVTDQDRYYDGNEDWACGEVGIGGLSGFKINKDMKIDVEKEWKELCEDKELVFWREREELVWWSECEMKRKNKE